MKDIVMKVGSDTYGLFLISDNWHERLYTKEHIDKLKEEFDNKKGVKYVNSWELFGVHDTAILVQSKEKLDLAVEVLSKWITDCTRKLNSEKGDLDLLPSDIKAYIDKCVHLSNICKEKDRKKFKIFEYRLDPLIPIYVNEEEIESNNGVFLIMYIKFNPKSVNDMLNGENHGNLKNLYEPFERLGASAIFQGFGLFDVIVIAKSDNYAGVEDMRTDMRNMQIGASGRSCIANTSSLTSVSWNSGLGPDYKSLNSFMKLKIRPKADEPGIWNDVRGLAEYLGLHRICVTGKNPPDQSLPYTSYIPGFFDVEVDTQFKDIKDLIKFRNALEHLCFVEDVVTIISYDTSKTWGGSK